MAQDVIGLDFGDSGVKIVWLRRSLTRIQWVMGQGIPYPEAVSFVAAPPSSGASEWIRSEFEERRIPKANVNVGLPVHLFSIRRLTLPFSDSKKLAQVTPYEVEGLLPYPLEEVVIDYLPVEQRGQETELLVLALPKTVLKPILDGLGEAGIDPVSIEPTVSGEISWIAGTQRKIENGVVLDIGADSTQIGFVRGGRLAGLRGVLSGGSAVTRAVQDKLGLDFADAEEAKRLGGLVEEAIARYRGQGLAQAVEAGMGPLIGSILETIHIYKTETNSVLEGIWLVGGGARLRGLDRFLSSRVGLSVSVCEPPGFLGSMESWDPALAGAVGLAVKETASKEGAALNFRRKEFAHSGEASRTQHRLRYVAVGALVVSLLLGADLYIRYAMRDDRYTSAKTQLRQEFQKAFPEVQTVVDELQQAKASLDGLKKTAVLLGYDELTPLQILAEITSRIPEDVKIEVQDLVVERGRVRMEAETDSFDSVDRIKSAIEAFDRFREVTVSDAKIGAVAGKVRFRLAVSVTGSQE